MAMHPTPPQHNHRTSSGSEQRSQHQGWYQPRDFSPNYQLPQTLQPSPQLRHVKTSPYSLNTVYNRFPEPTAGSEPRTTISKPDRINTDVVPSNPTSSRLDLEQSPAVKTSPTSASADDDDDDDDVSCDNDGDGKQVTPTEARNLKRKMKRFRLTHNQTRYLMSEFARQAHPDAAHRERLSREIPGLSPRQVQVWFQNRRAKLKRLTVEDRERMMSSRAIPDHFSIAPSLQTGFTMTPGASPIGYSPTTQTTGRMGSLTLDTMTRDDMAGAQNFVSPLAPLPPLGLDSLFTPPQSATEALTPTSTILDMNMYSKPSHPVSSSPRNGLYRSPHTTHLAYPMTLHGRLRQSSLESSSSSPLRTSVSYSSLDTPSHGQTPAVHSTEPPSFFRQRAMTASEGAYGLGIYYPQGTTESVPQRAQPQQQQTPTAEMPLTAQSGQGNYADFSSYRQPSTYSSFGTTYEQQ